MADKRALFTMIREAESAKMRLLKLIHLKPRARDEIMAAVSEMFIAQDAVDSAKADSRDESIRRRERLTPAVYETGGPLITVTELARRSNRNQSTVWRQIKKGQIPSMRIGGSFVVKKEDAEAYIDQCRINDAEHADRWNA